MKKPKKNRYKAEPVDKLTVEQLMSSLDASSFFINEQPYGTLFDIYANEFLNKSVDKGLIKNTHLSITGDGTPAVTSAGERKHHVCNYASQGIRDCDCERYFSQPDCDIDWNSSRGGIMDMIFT